MKICYIGDSKSVHTLRIAKHFAKKGNDVYILDYKAKQDDIIEEKIKVCTLAYPEERPFQYRGETLAFKERAKISSLIVSFNSRIKIIIELVYAWLIGHFPFIPRLPSYVLKSPLNSELIELDRYAEKAEKLLDKIKPDIVHSHYLTSWGYIAARTGFKPIISSAWGSDVLLRPKEDFAMRMKLQYAMSNSNVLTSDAKYLSQKMVNYGADKSKIKEFIWGIDLEKFFQLQKKDDSLPTIIHTRTSAPLYNVEPFLKALPSVLKSISCLKVFLKITGPLQSEIKSMIEKLDLESIVILLDYISEEELANHYRNSHIYVSLSKSDSTSVSLIEAMVSGCFPIVSNIPANREWIEDGINGFLVDLNNPRMLADRILQAFEHRELRIQAGKNNLEIIKSRAMWEDQVKNLENYYRQLINKVIT